MRIVFWGTYDTGKPRNRILLRGLRENKIDLTECHADIWSGVEDKSQIRTLAKKILFLCRWLLSYPGLLFDFCRLPKHDAVIVGYLGQLDVLILWPFARMRRIPIVWDAFLSLYDTVVNDRKMVGKYHPLALLLYMWEWLACRAADSILLDTQAHADYFVRQFHLPSHKTFAVFVGAETDVFSESPLESPVIKDNNQFTVLFYGQFIPLHGIETIINAARLMIDDPVQWIIIGQGQEEEKIRAMLDESPIPLLQWIPWVDYRELRQWIQRSDLCLGIFGESGKATRVIPNKVFQVLAAGKPILTRDSPAIRELLDPDMAGVTLVPPANPSALAAGIREISGSKRTSHVIFHRETVERLSAQKLAKELLDKVEQITKAGDV